MQCQISVLDFKDVIHQQKPAPGPKTVAASTDCMRTSEEALKQSDDVIQFPISENYQQTINLIQFADEKEPKWRKRVLGSAVFKWESR